MSVQKGSARDALVQLGRMSHNKASGTLVIHLTKGEVTGFESYQDYDFWVAEADYQLAKTIPIPEGILRNAVRVKHRRLSRSKK